MMIGKEFLISKDAKEREMFKTLLKVQSSLSLKQTIKVMEKFKKMVR